MAQAGTDQRSAIVPNIGIDGLGLLQKVLRTSTISTIAANIYWSKLLNGLPLVPPFFAAFEDQNKNGTGTSDIATQYAHGMVKQAFKPEAEPQKSMLDIVNGAVRSLLGSDVDMETPLLEAGLDSLGEKSDNVKNNLSLPDMFVSSAYSKC